MLNVLRAKLAERIALKHKYEAQQKPDCHPATRHEVLANINHWIHDEASDSNCSWFTGIAAVGKTAVALTTAQCLLDRRCITADTKAVSRYPEGDAPILAAQYFANYTLDSAEIGRLFPTLALQLAEGSPFAMNLIHDVIEETPSLVNKFGEEQATSLFFNPLRELCKLAAPRAVVVLIDGLDELKSPDGDNHGQTAILREVTRILCAGAQSLPKNVKLVLLSRPEAPIIESISLDVLRYHLDTTESRKDVHRLFQKRLSSLGHPGIPSRTQHDLLCRAADGHLGWAEQAMHWLSDILDQAGAQAFDDAVKEISQLVCSELSGLNILYCYILLRCLPSKLNLRKKSLEGLHKVLGVWVVLVEPQAISTIEKLVKHKQPFDVLRCFKRLSSLYATGAKHVTLDTVPCPHKSFFDFITSKALLSGKIPLQFQELVGVSIDPAIAHKALGYSCFRILNSEETQSYACPRPGTAAVRERKNWFPIRQIQLLRAFTRTFLSLLHATDRRRSSCGLPPNYAISYAACHFVTHVHRSSFFGLPRLLKLLLFHTILWFYGIPECIKQGRRGKVVHISQHYAHIADEFLERSRPGRIPQEGLSRVASTSQQNTSAPHMDLMYSDPIVGGYCVMLLNPSRIIFYALVFLSLGDILHTLANPGNILLFYYYYLCCCCILFSYASIHRSTWFLST